MLEAARFLIVQAIASQADADVHLFIYVPLEIFHILFEGLAVIKNLLSHVL